MKMRETQIFVTWPGSQAIKTVQYPDYPDLTSKTIDQIQPILMGVNRASLVAKFGGLKQFKTGGF